MSGWVPWRLSVGQKERSHATRSNDRFTLLAPNSSQHCPWQHTLCACELVLTVKNSSARHQICLKRRFVSNCSNCLQKLRHAQLRPQSKEMKHDQSDVDWPGESLSLAVESVAGVGMPVRAHLLSLFITSLAGARRGYWQLPDTGTSCALPSLVRGWL